MSIVPEPPASAVALTAFRELPDGRSRKYTEAWFPGNPWQGCEHFVRTCGVLGFLQESSADFKAYALLDLVDEDGEVVATYDVTHRPGLAVHLPQAETPGRPAATWPARRIDPAPPPAAALPDP